ncbi:transcription factor MYB34 [Gossypium australe]|uniref:Transcription factor MYB34 n=1 Tax=Gossypium australe TaxID=47621 RepID=A0A5B6VWC2_9ROSI|nr:transcription factor MYB34 [Gossypium australe]
MDFANQNNVQGNGVANAHNPILIYVVPCLNELNLRIRKLEIEASQFELKPWNAHRRSTFSPSFVYGGERFLQDSRCNGRNTKAEVVSILVARSSMSVA